MGGLVFIIIGVVIYFLPSFVGWNKKGASSVILINLLLGWTLIGWVVALLWAINSERETLTFNYECSYCGYKRKLNQKVKIYVCPQCNKETKMLLNKPIIKEAKKEVNNLKEQEDQDPIQIMKKSLKSDEIIIKVLGNRNIQVINIKDWDEIIALGNASKFEIIYKHQ